MLSHGCDKLSLRDATLVACSDVKIAHLLLLRLARPLLPAAARLLREGKRRVEPRQHPGRRRFRPLCGV